MPTEMNTSPYSYSMRRIVQFAETDLAGVLHFANYYRMMEEVEHAFWRSLGLSVIVSGDDGHISWPRVATSCEYFAPAHFEDELVLTFVIERVGQRSIAFQVGFMRNGERIAVGRTTAVCCAMKHGTFGPVAIPEHLRSRLEAHVTSAPET